MRTVLLVSAVLLVAPAAHAQNAQLQLRGVSAHTEVDAGHVRDASASAFATGNAVSAVNEGADATRTNDQTMEGDATATADATVWNADGVVAVTAAASGNAGASATLDGDVDITSQQTMNGAATASARATVGNAGDLSTSATGAGNVAAASIANGQLRAILTQEANGAISAVTEADACCINGQAFSGAIASANNTTIGGATSTILTDTRQVATGQRTEARADLYVGYSYDAAANATANNNALTIGNEWGYVNARVNQQGAANVQADAYVTLGGDFLGFASAGAHGVGNTVTISNVGSDIDLDVTQNNAGDVSANAAMQGEGGGMALSSAAAYGNNVSASLCGYCDTNTPELRANNAQVNHGAVSASAVVNTARARTVAATANAIGNAATFQSAGPGN